jgi:hypothetical protein
MCAAVVLFLFPPLEYGFYPKCLLHSWTGLSCPGCGSLRAMHQLLHGNLAEAFHYNPMLVLALPFFAAWGAHQSYAMVTGRDLFHLRLPRPAILGILAVIIVFAVLRNLPAFPSLNP